MIGKVALIVGGSRGIGKAVALELAKERMTVGIAYLRNERAAEETASEVRKLGGNAWLYRLDVKNSEEIKNMFQELEKKYRRIDVLIHAAALGVFKPLSELSSVQLTRAFDINTRSFILCAQESLKLMKNGGSIVAISSLGGQRYISQYGAIGIAKAALEAAVRYLAVEFASRGIRVNAVSGGPVDTAGVKLMPGYEKRKRHAIKMTPAGKIASPADIANVVAFLCKKESDWIRGQILIADGGLSLRLVGL
jgi:enoyl-[acyl-carrier protein] reductase III